MWLPVLGTGLGDTDSMVFRDLAFPLDPTGETSVLIFPVTYDDPKDDDEQDAQSQLTEFVGQEYILNSIVGKCHVGYMATAANRDLEADQVPKFVGVAAGFFVARADGGAPGVDDVPIGASGGNATRRNYSPLSPDTMREPWIWHRSWLFCPPTPRAEHSFDPFISRSQEQQESTPAPGRAATRNTAPSWTDRTSTRKRVGTFGKTNVSGSPSRASPSMARTPSRERKRK